MITVDEEALICDFAEVYGVFDYRQLPARRAAILACGLGPKSRIASKLSGAKVPLDILLLALVADALKILIWQNTKDGASGRNKPKSIVQGMYEGKETGTGFETADEFEAWRARMIGVKTNGD